MNNSNSSSNNVNLENVKLDQTKSKYKTIIDLDYKKINLENITNSFNSTVTSDKEILSDHEK